MIKDEITNILVEFYRMILRHELKLSFYSDFDHDPRYKDCPRPSRVNTKKFIVIGAASLVLQDRLSATSDIDLMTDVYTINDTLKILTREDIPAEIYCSDYAYADQLTFDFKETKFDILSNCFVSFLMSDLEKNIEICPYDVPIHLRPVDLIKEDYMKVIKYIGSHHDPEDTGCIQKYIERLSALEHSIREPVR